MKKWLLLIVVGLSSGAVVGCGEDEIPEVGFVNYTRDIQPILTARCVRCHGAGGMLNGDDYVTGPQAILTYKGKPNQGYFDCGSADRGDCSATGTDCKRGLRYYAVDPDGMQLKTAWLPSMPPQPSPPLTTREAELLKRWLAVPGPAVDCTLPAN